MPARPARRQSARADRRRIPLLLAAFLGVLAGSLSPMVTDPPAAAQTQGTTVSTSVSVQPQPDYVRVGWTDSGDGVDDRRCDDPDLDSSTCRFSVRDNDQIVLQRCAARAEERCVELTATCGAVFDDMERLLRLLDGLSTDLKANWDSRVISTGETPGRSPDFKLPAYGSVSLIGLAELLQASWPLLPVRSMFLNWDLEFIAGVDPNAQSAAGFADRLKAAIDGDYDEILRDNTDGAWSARVKAGATAQVDRSDSKVRPNNEELWVTNRDSGVGYPFPTFTLGALLNPATLATDVGVNTVPDNTSSAFAKALDDLTGGKSFNDWVSNSDGATLSAALDGRLSAQQRANLDSGDSARVQEVKNELTEAAQLATALSNDAGANVVPYTVRAALAFLKIIAEDSSGVLSGFTGGRSYEPHLFPFLVLFEAPDLVVGLLELFGLERPAYRSARDVAFDTALDVTFFEERAESLLLDMHDRCANDLVVQDDRFLRWEDPHALGGALTGDHASASRVEGRPVSGDSVFSTGHKFDVPTGPVGAELALTGLALGETTLWYCYSYSHAGCTEPWTSVTVLVEPAGWDDARVVIQRDHYHIVVDWRSGRVLVLRPSPEGALTLTTADWKGWGGTGLPEPSELGIEAGKWINDEHVRDYMPPTSWEYEIVTAATGPQDPTSAWSFEVELPVMDNDEVHFYNKRVRDDPAGPGNELGLLGVPDDDFPTCDTSRYCEHLGIHLLPGRKLPPTNLFTIDPGDTATSLTVTVNSRSTALGATQPLFGQNNVHKRVFSGFMLSYCVSALNVGCENWTDRRMGGSSVPATKQGHCVAATSLDDPVAPNAPRQLTVREWARRTGRPQGEFYFKRQMGFEARIGLLGYNGDPLSLGWGSEPIFHGEDAENLRNYECPALDPQNPKLKGALDEDTDWAKSTASGDDCGTSRNNLPQDEVRDGTRTHPVERIVQAPILKTPGYTVATTEEYKAYRRFWVCLGGILHDKAVVGKHILGDNRTAHPTDRNVLVTVEFINPDTNLGKQYGDVDDTEDAAEIEANCATEFRPTHWDDKVTIDPAERAIPADWCYPLAPCWNSDGEPMWGQSLTVEVLREAGCPREVGGTIVVGTGSTVGVTGAEDITSCTSFEDALRLRVDPSLTNACSPVAAANFALFEGCVRPSFAAAPRAGDGVLIPGHQRWVTPDHSGSFAGGYSSHAQRGPAEPGLPLFSVSATVTVDPVWQFCQDAEMDVVGIWPTYACQEIDADPSDPNNTLYYPWPGDAGPCDPKDPSYDANGPGPCDDVQPDDDYEAADAHSTRSHVEPRFEIDLVCERSYPRLYDIGRDRTDGIGLPSTWTDRLDDPDLVPCVGVEECETWTIPAPGFYRVRVMVDAPLVAKTGAAQTVVANTPGGLTSPLQKAQTLGWGALGVGADAASTEVTDPEPFVFDKIIWAQPLFARAG